MGQEVACTARHGAIVAKGKALFETDEILFRSPSLRLHIPLKGLVAKVEGGDLVLRWGKTQATLSLGANAAKWADKIANPKSVLDKLGMKAHMRVAIVSFDDAAFVRDLGKRECDVHVGAPRAGEDVIFFGVTHRKELDRIAKLATKLAPSGALWVLRPKGVADVGESDVMRAGKASGLVDVKVVRFSETHTAEKFVIPVAKRRPI